MKFTPPAAKYTPSVAHLLLAAIAVLTAAWVGGGWGPLTPPGGAVTSTAKTLGEVEPRIAVNATNTPGDVTFPAGLYKITQPGSYYLTGNVTGVSGRNGIVIMANDVTLDLNGFTLTGVAGALNGVYTNNGLSGIAVLNGTARSWPSGGVNCASVNFSGRIVGVHAQSNTNYGIAGGNAMTVRDCSARSNTGAGIVTYQACIITACESYANTGDGYSISTGTALIGCTAYSNGGNGLTMGFNSGSASQCFFYANTGSGVMANSSSSVVDCTCIFNGVDGITVFGRCLVRGNLCDNNGAGGTGAGIHATGSDNHIEGNTCNFAQRGVQADGAGNLITRNACASNTINWLIAANNVCGPIVDRTAPASAAISGNFAPSSLGNTEPNANFTY